MTPDNREETQAFDIDVSQNVDHVVIYTNDNPDKPPFEAVPFYHRDTFEDGREWYHEPDDFEVTPEYREAVAEHADIRIEDVKLTREFETHELDPI